MSSNTNFTCRETYYSYGSYLRSRGYDKEICNLVAAIEAGQIKIGPITPGSCPSAPTTINNSVTINGCPSGPTSTTGILKVTGGNIGPVNVDPSGSITSFLSGSTNYGIQSSTGIRNLGPIYSSTDCSRSNYFGAVNHIFAGGSSGDCSTNVIVRGNLLVDGSTVEIGGFIGETLTLTTLPGNTTLGTLNLFRSPFANGNTMTVYNDTSDNILAGNWQTGLTFSIDGNLENTTTGSGIDRIAGMSDTQGHVRSFRGITVSNPPSAGQAIDICYNRDISGSSYALQVYGDLTIDRGNNDASGNIDLSGGDINFYLNNNKNAYIHANGDASFNGHVTIYDLSVINVMTVGTSTTYIDTNDVSTNNLNANNVNAGFLIVDNSLNTSFIYSPLLQDLTIQAGAANVEFVANKVIIDDLSVNQISANSININIVVFNTINTTDLSVNHQASIYDLSVTNLLNVGDVTITQTQVQTNTLRSTNTNPLTIQGGTSGTENINVSATNVNMRDNVSLVTISDLSVNDISASQIDVTNIDVSSIITSNTINNTSKITTTDLSVNSHASIYDLSVQHILTVGISTEILSDTVRTSLVDCGNLQVSDSAQFNNNINVSNTIYTTDLSVNGHASIYDLSVTNLMTVGTSIDTNSINAISGIFDNSLNVNDNFSVNHSTGMIDFSAIDVTFNNSLKIYKTGDTNYIQTPYGISNDNLFIYTEGRFNLDVSQNMVISGNEQIDITSAGFTEITAGQGIDLSANQDITFTATDVSFINVSNVYFGNSVVDISDLRIGSRISTSKIVSPNDELQISSIQNGMTFTSLSGDISFTSNKSGFFVDASQGITFQGHSSSVYFYGNSANFVDMSVNMLDLSVNNIITNSIDTNNSSNIISFGNTRLHDISSIIVENSIITKSVLSSSSNLTVGAVNGNLNLNSLGGNININAGNNDISFNADTITFDASVCFLKDPSIKEVDFSGRELKIYGSSTIIFDISGPYKSTVENFVPEGTTDLSFVIPPVYNDLNPPSLFNSIFTENYIDFSNNQTAVTNMLFEVYLSISAKFTNSNDALIFQFINVDNSSNVVDIDTRSGNILNSFNTVVFGPVNIVSKPGADDDFIKKQWKIGVTQYGSGVKIHSDPRLTIKMKSIV